MFQKKTGVKFKCVSNHLNLWGESARQKSLRVRGVRSAPLRYAPLTPLTLHQYYVCEMKLFFMCSTGGTSGGEVEIGIIKIERSVK